MRKIIFNIMVALCAFSVNTGKSADGWKTKRLVKIWPIHFLVKHMWLNNWHV